jgi:hypothetical protein
VAFALLCALGAAVFGPHIVHGGFYSDDWRNAAMTHYSGGVRGAIDFFAGFTPYRPLLIIYVPLTHWVFGLNSHLHLAWSAALGVFMSTAFFVLLRSLGMRPIHAGAIAALVLVFPLSDAIRLWGTPGHASLAVVLYLAGAVVALRGLRETGRRAKLFHAGAIALYVLAISSYELVAVPVFCSVVLYATRVPWRATLWRFAADATAAIGMLIYVSLTIDPEHGKVSGPLGHAAEMAGQAVAVVSYSTIPFSAILPFHHRAGTAGVVLVGATLAVVALAGWLVARSLSHEDPVRHQLRWWLAAAGIGIVAIAAGYAMLIPNKAYLPLDYGSENRVNLFAALGVVTLIYSLAMVAAILVFRRRADLSRTTTVVGVLVAVVLGVGYISRTESDAKAWDRAADLQGNALDGLQRALPDPPEHSTIYTFGHPNNSSRLVPVFRSDWDLNGAVKIRYDDPTLVGIPMTRFTKIVCLQRRLYPSVKRFPHYGPKQGADYGTAFLVDTTTRAVAKIDNRKSCMRAAASFKPGPVESP